VVASIGAVCGIDSPAQAALALCREADALVASSSSMSPVRMLVGKEAWLWARDRNLSTVGNEAALHTFQVNDRAVESWNHAFNNHREHIISQEQAT